MSIVLPIVFFAVALGLTVRRMTPLHWGLMAFWIVLVIAYNFAKHSSAMPASAMPNITHAKF